MSERPPRSHCWNEGHAKNFKLENSVNNLVTFPCAGLIFFIQHFENEGNVKSKRNITILFCFAAAFVCEK